MLAVPTNHVGIFERFAIPEKQVVSLDLRRPFEEMIISQPLGTVLYGLRMLPNLLGWNVAVVGQGPIGLLFAPPCGTSAQNRLSESTGSHPA